MLNYGLFHEKVYSLIMLWIRQPAKSLLLFTIISQQTNGKVKVQYLPLRKEKKKKEEKYVGPVGSITLKQ